MLAVNLSRLRVSPTKEVIWAHVQYFSGSEKETSADTLGAGFVGIQLATFYSQEFTKRLPTDAQRSSPEVQAPSNQFANRVGREARRIVSIAGRTNRIEI